jgi:hypothetical protein
MPPLPGAVLFARYAYPPNELGYCGPDEAAALLANSARGVDSPEIAGQARQFDGAWVYLELLAEAAGIEDPLDARVVTAYWVGNELLDRVSPDLLRARLAERFAGQSGGFWSRLGADSQVLARAHHSFHVFAVYPWAALLGSGSGVPLSVLDRCRVRWGQVLDVRDEQAVVRSRALTWDGSRLALGQQHTETVRWSAAGRSLLADVRTGDWVALHWDWICDRLQTKRLAALQQASAQQLHVANLELSAAAQRRARSAVPLTS